MYAVVRTGGEQYRVEPGNTFEIEKLDSDVGDTIEFKEVLLVGDGGNVTVGQPIVAGAKVVAKVTEQKRGPKLVIFKKIRRHGHQLKKGHRQSLTRVTITEINF